MTRFEQTSALIFFLQKRKLIAALCFSLSSCFPVNIFSKIRKKVAVKTMISANVRHYNPVWSWSQLV